MKFVHRIGFRASQAQRRALEELGVKLPAGIAYPDGGDPLLAFDVNEAHPNWTALSSLFRAWRVSDVPRTEFTKKEIAAARWVEVSAWHHGYPQPDEDRFGYRQATFDLSEWCERCGVGAKQKAPFQMKREPKWGRNAIMQLIWVYGELFVTPDVWKRVFAPAGIACMPVLGRKGTELETVVQLVVTAEVNVVTRGLTTEHCTFCGRTKYRHVTRGPFPPLREAPAAPMVRTAEYFGSGGKADQLILMSQNRTHALMTAGVRGASLMPVAEAGSF